MDTTKLSSKGQVIIPKSIRAAHHWEAGQELIVIDTGDGILLKTKTPFSATDLSEVASCLKYEGRALTVEDMQDAVNKGLQEQLSDCG